MQSTLPSSFLTIWLGQLLSCLGTGRTRFALGVSVYLETRSAVEFAMVILHMYLSSIVLRPIAEVLADRFDRRVIMAAADAGSAPGVLFLLSGSMADSLVPW